MRLCLWGTRFSAKFWVLAFLLLFSIPFTQAMSLPNEPGKAGDLRIVGNYPSYLQGYVVVGLRDGKVLAYGSSDMGVGGEKRKRWSKLRDFNARVGAAMHGQSAYQWNPKKRSWSKVEPPAECHGHRYLHTMTALPHGKVLIAGGLCDVPRLRNETAPYPHHNQLSLWNSATETWERAPALSTSRIFHTANPLPDGSVLIVGGESDPALGSLTGEPVLSSVERYRDGRVSKVASLAVARARHTATSLVNGSTLVAGGFDKDGKAIADAELWDGTRQVWRSVAPMQTPRHSHSATLLGDGRVMVTGGVGADGEAIGSVEIWDPQRNAWSAGDPLLLPLKEHTITRLANGDVLAVGSSVVDEASVINISLWDKLTRRWQIAGTRQLLDMQGWLPQPITVIPYADGSAHVFTPGSIFHWTRSQAPVSHPLYGKRRFHTTTLTAGGRILLAGGQAGGWTSKESVDWAEVFNPASGRFSVTGRMNLARSGHTALTLADGRIVVADGIANHPNTPQQRVANSPEIWDPRTGQWSLISAIRFEAEGRVHMGQLHNGTVLFFNVRVVKDGETFRPTGYGGWTWNPADGRVEQIQVSGLSPRLRAAIAVLPDGRVLIAGGHSVSYVPAELCTPASQTRTSVIEEEEGEGCRDEPARWVESANHTAELWDIRSGTITAIDPPPGRSMENPKTLLLKSGQVVITDWVPINPYNVNPAPLPVLLWHPASRKWSQLPPVLAHQGWPMTELKDGALATKSQRLPPGASSWIETPSVHPNEADLVELPDGRLQALSMESPYQSFYDASHQRWQMVPARYEMPRWRSKPALLPLQDGRLMAVGQVEGGHVGIDTAHIWNSRDSSWTVAGKLARGYGGPKQVVQLPSGRVLHIGTYSGSHVCELWEPSDNTWAHCETLTISAPQGRSAKFVLGTLDNGQAAFLFNTQEALVFREAKRAWARVKLEWNGKEIAYGAPIRPEKPFARLYDEESRTWVDASALATKFLESVVDPTPILLWDRKKRELAYNFIPGVRGMGYGAIWLPDGCAVATLRSASAAKERFWTIFNPSTGEVTKHIDPGSGIIRGGEFSVLTDGTVVVIDATYGAPGATGFFHRKMSCSGFVKQADDAYLIPPHNTQLQGDNTSPPSQVRPPEAPWAERLHNQVWQYRWLLLALLAPVVIYGLLKRLILPWGRKLFVRFMNLDRAAPLAHGFAKAGAPSRSFRLSLRVILYGTALVISLPLLGNILFFNRMERAEEYATNPAAFLNPSSGILKPIPALAEKSRDAKEAKIPCRFVGVWSAIRGASVHRITLKGDGRYEMAADEYSSDRNSRYTGYWAVQGNNMIWRHEQLNTTQPDINPILPESESAFTLIEENGRRTRYERIKPIVSSACSPE